MGECSHCSEQVPLPFVCKFCGERYCGDHRLPENHGCLGLQRFKEDRGREIEKWIYEPFSTRFREKVGREVSRPLTYRLRALLLSVDSRKALYLLLLLILLLTLWRGLSV
jgi:hypothetical protein